MLERELQMLNFNDYFKDEYQFSLRDVSYSKIECEQDSLKYELKISDTINAELKEDSLYVTFTRDVYFEPASMFNLKVVFDIILHLNEEATEKATGINWSQTLLENPNLYLGNVVSRTSHLIAEITASFGQQPLITPPNPIAEAETI